MEEDIYDFSGLSLDDLCIGAPGALLNGRRLQQRMRLEDEAAAEAARTSSTALFEGRYDEEEWYPPTPPPYDVADKLVSGKALGTRVSYVGCCCCCCCCCCCYCCYCCYYVCA